MSQGSLTFDTRVGLGILTINGTPAAIMLTIQDLQRVDTNVLFYQCLTCIRIFLSLYWFGATNIIIVVVIGVKLGNLCVIASDWLLASLPSTQRALHKFWCRTKYF